MSWSFAGNEERDNDANNSPVTVAGSLFTSIYLQLVMLPLVLLIIQMLTRAKGQPVGLLESPVKLSASKVAVRWSSLQGQWPVWHAKRGLRRKSVRTPAQGSEILPRLGQGVLCSLLPVMFFLWWGLMLDNLDSNTTKQCRAKLHMAAWDGRWCCLTPGWFWQHKGHLFPSADPT